MENIWSKQAKFEYMLQVEKEVSRALAMEGIIPKEASTYIEKAKFDIEKIELLEKTLKHDVASFVQNLSDSISNYGNFVHYGLTSSDVLDTALSLQVVDSFKCLEASFDKLEGELKKLCLKHVDTLCVGRTHGMHADVTTFGLKIAGHLAAFIRSRLRIKKSIEGFSICKLSGTVGSYSTLPPKIETIVATNLSLTPETVATQVVPRDRHAEVIFSLAIYSSAVERLAVELRHLQRTEVNEVKESFAKGQQGSSAMPHKKNPISSENLCGLSRLMRSYVTPVIENISLWHERDISHSSVERVIFPDAFTLLDYQTQRCSDILKNLVVDKTKMLSNLKLSERQILSSKLLLKLLDKNMPRKKAYSIVQDYMFSEKDIEEFKMLDISNIDSLDFVKKISKKLIEKICI